MVMRSLIIRLALVLVQAEQVEVNLRADGMAEYGHHHRHNSKHHAHPSSHIQKFDPEINDPGYDDPLATRRRQTQKPASNMQAGGPLGDELQKNADAPWDWAAAEQMSKDAIRVANEQADIHGAVQGEFQDMTKTLEVEAVGDTGAITEKTMAAQQSVNNAMTQVDQMDFDRKTAEDRFKAEQKAAQTQMNEVAKKDVKSTAQLVTHATKMLAKGESAVEKAMSNAESTDAKMVSKITSQLNKIPGKLEKADKTQEINERTGSQLTKAEDKHNKNLEAIQEKLQAAAALAEKTGANMGQAEGDAEQVQEEMEKAYSNYEVDFDTAQGDAVDKAEGQTEELENKAGENIEEFEDEAEEETVEKDKEVTEDQEKLSGEIKGAGDEIQMRAGNAEKAAEAQDKKLQDTQNVLSNGAEELQNTAGEAADDVEELASTAKEAEKAINDKKNEVKEKLIEKGTQDFEGIGQDFAQKETAAKSAALTRINSALEDAKVSIEKDFQNDEHRMKAKGDTVSKTAEQARKTAEALETATKDEVEETKTQTDKLANLEAGFTKEWNKRAVDDAKKLANFQALATKAEQGMKSKIDKEYQDIKTDGDDIAKKTQKTVEDVEKEIGSTASDTQKAMEKKYNMAEKEVESVQVISPNQVSESVHNAEQRAAEVEQSIPEIEEAGLAKWNAAADKVSEIKTKADQSVEEAKRKIDTGVAQLQQAVEEDTKEANAAMGPELAKNQKDISNFRSDFDQKLASVQQTEKNGVAAAETELSNIGSTIEERSKKVQDLKGELQTKLTKAKHDLENKEYEVDGAIKDGNLQITQLKQQLNDELSKALVQIRTKSDADRNQLTAAAGAQTEQVEQQVKVLESGAREQAKQLIETLRSNAGEIDPTQLQAQVSQLFGTVQRMKGDLSDDDKDLRNKLQAMGAARDKDVEGLEDRLQEMASDVSKQSDAALAKARQTAQETLDTATHDAKKEVTEGENAITKSADELNTVYSEFQGKAGTAMNKEGKELGALRGELNDYKGETEAVTDQVKRTIHAVEDEERRNQEQVKKAESGLGRKIAENTAEGKEEAEKIVSEMSEDAEKVKEAILAQRNAEDKSLEGVVADAAETQRSLETPLNGIQKKLQTFHQKIEASESYSDHMSEDAGNQRQQLQAQVQQLSKQFMSALDKTKQQRVTETGAFRKENSEIFGTLDDAVDTLKKMEKQVVGMVQGSVGKVAQDEQSLDSNLNHMVELEKYQDENAVKKVKSDMADLTKLLERLNTWRSAVTENVGDWRKAVQEAFVAVGSSFEVVELETSEQQAAERSAIEGQMNDLGDHLQHDLGSMSEHEKKQIALLAAQSGKAIAALMANEKLSRAEKAEQLAKIKAQCREEARKVLEANNEAGLEAENAERKINVAQADIENVVERIGALSGSSMPTFDSKGTAKDQLNDIMGMAKSAEQYMAENPVPAEEGSLAQLRGVSTPDPLQAAWDAAPAAEKRKALQEANAFIEQHQHGAPTSFAESQNTELEKELKEARRAVEEDDAWKAKLHELAGKVQKS